MGGGGIRQISPSLDPESQVRLPLLSAPSMLQYTRSCPELPLRKQNPEPFIGSGRYAVQALASAKPTMRPPRSA